jgi:predicted TIM-barrel fold metal-dependent hydrolase
VLDGHCHLVPPWLREAGSAAWHDPWFATCHGGARPRFASGQEVVAELDREGGGRAVVFGWPFSDSGLLAEVNDWVAGEVARYPTRLTGFAMVNPASDRAVPELERCRSMGLAGLGELNADGQGFELDWQGGLRRTLMACSDLAWPALLHCSEPVGHDYAGKGTATPDRLWRLLSPLLEEAEGLRLCLAHLGGGLPLYAHMPEVARLCRGLWFDTAALPYLYSEGVLAEVSRLIGRGRICFGTDFPLLPPSRYRTHLEAVPTPGGGDFWLEEATLRWVAG